MQTFTPCRQNFDESFKQLDKRRMQRESFLESVSVRKLETQFKKLLPTFKTMKKQFQQ